MEIVEVAEVQEELPAGTPAEAVASQAEEGLVDHEQAIVEDLEGTAKWEAKARGVDRAGELEDAATVEVAAANLSRSFKGEDGKALDLYFVFVFLTYRHNEQETQTEEHPRFLFLLLNVLPLYCVVFAFQQSLW